jgi:hypothetical protein
LFKNGLLLRAQHSKNATWAGRDEDEKMKRYALCLALVSFGFGSLALPAPALAASAEVKKACNDQWEAEKKGNTIPRGMTHEKYMKQCTTNYAANVTPPVTQTPAADQSAPVAAWPPAPGQ